MTPKELLYIEDALGHIRFMTTQCNQAVSQLTDPTLKQAVQKFANNNHKLFTQFFNLV